MNMINYESLFPDIEISRPRYYFGNSFAFDSGADNVWDTATLDRERVLAAIDCFGLGDKGIRCPDGAREWGYTFFIPSDLKTGDNTYGNGGFPSVPRTRAEAAEMLKSFLYEHYGVRDIKGWEACPGHYLWQHYSCECGCGSVCSEVGESISSTQTHIAFCRGAARQFGIPWGLQFSFWQQGRINDYTGDSVWHECSQENGGHSASLYRRTCLAAYMGGASHFYPEACAVINFRGETDENGLYCLSPIGKMSQSLYRFINRNRDIGTRYTPFGIVLDYYHGMFSGDRRITKKKIFQSFDFEAGDDMTFRLFDMFFPDSWVTFGANEATYMVNGAYGDTCDVLLQNAPQEVLNSYPCLILSGGISLSDAETERYITYVQSGGELILNTAYLEYFPEYSAKYNGRRTHSFTDGKGRVTVYGPDYCLGALDGIIRERLASLFPFEISGAVEYFLNVKPDALILTLINNDGYYYNHTNGEDIDPSGTKELTVTCKSEGKLTAVRELWSETVLPPDRTVKTVINPGDVKIFEFIF